MNIIVGDNNFLAKLPAEPGVYRFYAHASTDNSSGELLYVGKAVNLLKRVKSYFQNSANLSPRIKLMVQKIVRIEITITDNEVSALILESNLIKTLKPKYNILFRDDKSYPLIRLSQHQFPALTYFRAKHLEHKQDKYFGPYPNVIALKQMLDMLQRLFLLRTCTDNFFASRTRPCMLHQIKRCSAPCVGRITPSDYQQQLNTAQDFLRGKFGTIVRNLNIQMNAKAADMHFEEAAILRDTIRQIQELQTKQIINNYQEPLNADLILGCEDANKIFIYVMILRNGLYVGDKHFILDDAHVVSEPDTTDTTKVNLAVMAFVQTHYATHENLDCIFTFNKLSSEFKKLFLQASQIEIKDIITHQLQGLYTMGQNNLNKIIRDYNLENNLALAATELANVLGVPVVKRVECFDISHHHGQNTVASLVVYENGHIDNKKYRRYNLLYTEDGKLIAGDDLLAMATVLKRRLDATELPVPDVIIVDGGSKQLKILKNILHNLNLYDRIRAVAIYKGAKRDPQLDRVVLDDGKILKVSDNILVFRLLQSLRDEAHRFAITSHRQQQIKRMVSSCLDEIPNIGIKKRQALIAHFGSVQNIMHKSVDELCQVSGIGRSLAKQIHMHFHGE